VNAVGRSVNPQFVSHNSLGQTVVCPSNEPPTFPFKKSVVEKLEDKLLIHGLVNDSFYRRPWKRDKIPENKLCD
jgi:hypothetical protein